MDNWITCSKRKAHPSSSSSTFFNMHDAGAFGRQRRLMSQAQALATEIRGSSLDDAALKQSYPKLIELARLVKRFVDSTIDLPAEGKAMWEQRGQWLQEE